MEDPSNDLEVVETTEGHPKADEPPLCLAFTDGKSVSPMVPACDYKRVFDDDKGPNTGGMGGYSPPGFFSQEMVAEAVRTVLDPTVRAMGTEKMPYRGVLYAGLMITAAGIKVLEFNARFGDPETQVMLPRPKTDLVDIMLAVTDGKLGKMNIEWSQDPCVGVVMASGGYPGKYQTGFPISGLDKLDKGIMVFHAGTALKGGVVTSGGRVLTVAANGKSIAEARSKIYSNISPIQIEGCQSSPVRAARTASLSSIVTAAKSLAVPGRTHSFPRVITCLHRVYGPPIRGVGLA